MSNAARISMPASAKIVKADKIVCSISLPGNENSISSWTTLNGDNGDYFATELRMADIAVQHAGLHSSFAHVTLPMLNFGPGNWVEKAFAWYTSNKIQSMKMRLRACVYIQAANNKTIPLITGTIVRINHNTAHGAPMLEIWDDKWLLHKVTCFGQAQYDPETKTFAYVNNPVFPLVFNQHGWPNCIDKPIGGGSAPCFAPTLRYGWTSDPRDSSKENGTGSPSEQSDGEPAPGYATTRARSWRVVDAIQYLRMMHYKGDDSTFPNAAHFPQGMQVTSGLIWPKGIEQVLTGAAGGSSRVLHDCDCEGLTLDAALTKLAHRAGPYELYMLPQAAQGGDNGNDVGAGALGQSAFSTFGNALNSAVGSLNSAFTAIDGTYAAFTTALTSFQTSFTTAFSSFQTQTTGPYANAAYNAINEKITNLNNHINGLGSQLFTNPQDAQQAISQQYQALVAQLGMSLNGNPGTYTLPNGSVFGSNATASVGTNSNQTNNASLIPTTVSQTFQQQANASGAQQNGNPTAPGNQSTLTFVDMRGPSANNFPVIPALYPLTLDEAMTQGENAISAGNWSESIVDAYDAAEIFGDPPSYESVFSMSAYDPNGAWLEPAWSSDDEKAFNKYYTSQSSSPNTSQAFAEACLMFPLVYCAYRVKKGYMKLFKGTKWEGYYAGRQHPRIRPTLLTAYQQQNDNPQNWTPRPIILESYGKVDDNAAATATNWTAAAVYDNLQLSQDGQYFMVTALRDNGPGSAANGTAVTHDFASDPTKGFQSVPIRATLAIELDWRLSAYYAKNTDKDAEDQFTARVQKPKQHDLHVYTALSKEGDYVDFNRWKSAPIGQIIPAAYRQFPDKAASGADKNLFTDAPTATTGRLYNHTVARAGDNRRVAGGGTFIFPRFALGYPPGAGIKSIGTTGIAFRGCVTTHVYKANDVEASTVETATPSPSDISRGTQ